MGQSKITADRPEGGRDGNAAGEGAATGIDWRPGGVPVSRRFDDPYFSLDGGLAETRHVFLAGNDLPQRFRDGFHVAELGFGTGLSLVATILAWEESGAAGRFRFTSFEAFPLGAQEIGAALSQVLSLGPADAPTVMPRAAPLIAGLVAAWGRGERRFALGPAEVAVIEGDARATLPAWQGRADAWFLDGFAPARNPELWEPQLLAQVAAHALPGATFATYTAAGHVRRALGEAGFDVLRVPGYGRKRHMSRGRLGPPVAAPGGGENA